MKQALTILTLIATAIAAAAQAPATKPEILFLENAQTKIGIDRAMGASITWLSWKSHPKNSINIHDPGRLIQQSYYAGRSIDRTSDGQSKAWSPWPWNPIQGGGVGSWAMVSRFEKQKDTLISETIPKLWDMPDENAEAIMHQWTNFENGMPNVIVVRNELIAKRQSNDRWGPATERHQEVPACYFTRSFDQFQVYLGKGEWRTLTQPPGPPWGKAQTPRKAMACFNADGQGIAIFSPTSGNSWNFGPHAAGLTDEPTDGPCVHIAPISLVHLGPQSTYSYRYWLVVGDQSQITKSLDALWERHAEEKGKLTHRESFSPVEAP